MKRQASTWRANVTNQAVAYSLLDEPLLRIRREHDDLEHATLPGVLAHLSASERDVVSFEALQAHQKQAWYSFLVQIAAMALARDGRSELPPESETWRDLLVALADHEPAAWAMSVEDLERPAFLQSPVPEHSLDEAGYEFDLQTPDELDMLVTSKNHDIKRKRIQRPRPEHWIYALVTLQTLQGYSGRSNYGIVRMNGGYANRQLVGIAPGLSWTSRFQRDVDILLDERGALLDRGYDDSGIALVWTVPWNGSESDALSLRECDPYFVEICRRVRFRLDDEGSLVCGSANTTSYRMAEAHDVNGVTGDPWTPVEDERNQKALNVSGDGFDYELLAELLQGDGYDRPPAMQITDHEDGDCYLIATTIVREKGGTNGWYKRCIPLPEEISHLEQDDSSEWRQLLDRADERVELAEDVEGHVLAPALMRLLGITEDGSMRGSDLVGHHETWLRRQRDQFDDAVDDIFFEALWESLDMKREEATRQWQSVLFGLAEEQFEEAVESVPLPSVRQYCNVAQAYNVLRGSARRHLETYFEHIDESDRHESND